MAIEEERRYIALQQERKGQRPGGTSTLEPQKANVKLQPTSTVATLYTAATMSFSTPVPQRIDARELEGTNVSLAWLSTERQMMLKERNSSRPVSVSLRPATDLAVEVQSEPNQHGLIWVRHDSNSQGYALLSNIESVTRSGNGLQFSVGKFKKYR